MNTASIEGNAGQAGEKVREFHFTDKEFQFIREMVTSHTGIKLPDAKREMVYGRLSRRLRELSLNSFSDYCALLEKDADSELGHLVNAITTNLTSFFREKHHFDYMKQTLAPLLEKHNRDKRVRIWSAGCSTGAEPYSIAMTMSETLPSARGWDVKILATDIDTKVLQTGKDGIYHDRDVTGVSDQQLRRWFQKGKGEHEGTMRVQDELRDMITFRQLNLLGPWPMKKTFDFIFCRNVVIYFDKDTQRKLFSRYADHLAPGGHLFIGHSESLYKVSDRFKLIGQTIYRKTE